MDKAWGGNPKITETKEVEKPKVEKPKLTDEEQNIEDQEKTFHDEWDEPFDEEIEMTW